MAEHSKLGHCVKMDDIEIKVLGDKQTEWEVLTDPWLQFFHNEPINTTVKGFQDPANEHKLVGLLRHNVNYDEESPCVLAWDRANQKAAGTVVTNTLYKDPPPHLTGKEQMPWSDFKWDEEFLAGLNSIGTFLDKLMKGGDVFNRYKVDKVLLIHITSVCPEYTRRGLANRMTDVVLKEAKNRGYKLVVSESTSNYTQRSKIKNFGFENVFELHFNNDLTTATDIPEELRSHTKGCLLVKRLD